MRFSMFRAYHDRLRAMTGVYEKEAIVRELLRTCAHAHERAIAAQFLVGKLSQPWEGLTTGLKEAFVAKDLGLEGKQSFEGMASVILERAEPKAGNRSLEDVWAAFRSYIKQPSRSHAEKSRIVSQCLFDLPDEKEDALLLLQILCEKVNNGVDEKTVLYALFPDQPRDRLARAYAFNPNLVEWVYAAEDEQARGLFEMRPVLGIALKPQLCAPATSLEAVLKEHSGQTVVQPKLDGQRVHIHFWWDGSRLQVRIFSRTLKDMTTDYPEIVRAFSRLAKEGTVGILDGELVALDAEGDVAPFSVLQKRLGRKEDREAVQVGIVLYDLLLWNTEPVGQMPYMARCGLLLQAVEGLASPKVRFIESEVVTSFERLSERLAEAQENGEEGLVCKDPNSLPEPGSRSKAWIKVKAEYMDGMGLVDSVDLVVVGFEKGRGKRHGKVGALWLAAPGPYPPVAERLYFPVCKVGTGFSDDDLDAWTRLLMPSSTPLVEPFETWTEWGAALRPFHKCVPEHVVEIKASEVSTSPSYPAGISLRFPRYMRHRPDKNPEQATALQEVQAMQRSKPSGNTVAKRTGTEGLCDAGSSHNPPGDATLCNSLPKSQKCQSFSVEAETGPTAPRGGRP